MGGTIIRAVITNLNYMYYNTRVLTYLTYQNLHRVRLYES